jgi:meiosis-specific transcription factor NDT80
MFEKFIFSFHAAPGLLVSPVESSSGSSSTSPSSAASSFAYASLANVIPNTVTSTEGFPPTPSSVYSHPANLQWNERMADFRLQRVPAL